jgi:ubiquinone/menaquinone biosynthesis C-methylase UbiE
MDTEEMLRRHYDAFARQYDGMDQGLDLLLSRLKLPPKASVLDIGCGTGNLTLRLPEKGMLQRVVGVDVSEGVLEIARSHARDRQLAGFEFIKASACHLPFAEGEFDAVVSNMVLHLVPDQRRAFAEVVRVLKSSGTAWLQFQGGGEVAAEWMEIFRRVWREHSPGEEPPALIQRITAQAVEENLSALGIRDFDVSWRRRVRSIAHLDVPKVLEFGKVVLGFWRWGLAEEAVQRIDEEIARQVTEKAANGTLTTTVNVLLVEFQKAGHLERRR